MLITDLPPLTRVLSRLSPSAMTNSRTCDSASDTRDGVLKNFFNADKALDGIDVAGTAVVRKDVV